MSKLDDRCSLVSIDAEGVLLALLDGLSLAASSPVLIVDSTPFVGDATMAAYKMQIEGLKQP